jgi:hypothetical protein
MTPEQEIKRGAEAELVLNNPIYIEAFDQVEKGLINAIRASALGDEKTHNKLAISLQLLGQINNALRTVMQSGKMAKIQVNESFPEKVKKFVRR